MKKGMKRIGSIIFTGVMHMVFFMFGVGVCILYRGRVLFTDPAAKAAMKQGAILIANHISHKDGFFVPHMLFPRKIYTVVTNKWYRKKFLNPMFRRLRYIPIDLETQDATWMTMAEEKLRNGECVLIFPEGKLETDGVPEAFHSGFLLMARHLDVPVIPMGLVGDYRLFHRQTLRIGSPLKLNLHAKGRLSAVLEPASQQCKEAVFALVEGETKVG